MVTATSNTIQIIISGGGTPPSWAGTPAPIFPEGIGSDGAYSVPGFVTNYNALTDSISIAPGSVSIGPGSSHPWLTFNGTLLIPDGTEHAADSFSGLILRLSRTGFPPVDSASFSVTVTPAVVINDTWTRLDNGGVNNSISGAFFYGAASRDTTGDIYALWKDWVRFNRGNGTWTTIKAENINVGRENGQATYDPVNDVIIFGEGTSNGPVGQLRYNIATNTYTNESSSGMSTGGAMVTYHNGFLYGVGGFGVLQQLTRGSPTLPTAGTTLGALNHPALSNGCSQYTMYRSGVDRRTGQAWCFDNNNDLNVWNSGTNRWSVIPTFGAKPPTALATSGGSNNYGGCACMVAVLNEHDNSIVAFIGYNGMVVGEESGNLGSTQVRTTYVLNLGTGIWRLGPSGSSAPPAKVVSAMVPFYNRFSQKVNVIVQNSVGEATEVWEFSQEGPQV